MRLESLTIGSESLGDRHRFKNLRNITIDFDQNHWVTVLIGWNGTGKSNVLEALASIFRDLIMGKDRPSFAYRISYRCREKRIEIDADPDRAKQFFVINITDFKAKAESGADSSRAKGGVNKKEVSYSAFRASRDQYLPRYVFGYYSGLSSRMQQVFSGYLSWYDQQLRGGADPGLRHLFYALPVHSQFVLLAFILEQDQNIKQFLEFQLGIDPHHGIESVLLVLKQPPWKSKKGNPTFWNAVGRVSEFLDCVYDISVAPVRIRRRTKTSLWNERDLEFLYLYIKDKASLKRLVDEWVKKKAPNRQPNDVQSLDDADRLRTLFQGLESTYVSEMIDEVRIRINIRRSDGTVTFRELSEGEQQLLTVLGLLRFTVEEESLFLLDEPDTHLNPRWSVDYLDHLRDVVGTNTRTRDSSHVVLTTHNPLAIAELVKEQVQILHWDEQRADRRIIATHPSIDPRGMGYAGIVTSDMFGLAAALDNHTLRLLERKRVLSLKEFLMDSERDELDQLTAELDQYGFRYSMRDPLYEEYLRARFTPPEQAGPKRRMLDNAEKRAKARALLKKAAGRIRKEEENKG